MSSVCAASSRPSSFSASPASPAATLALAVRRARLNLAAYAACGRRAAEEPGSGVEVDHPGRLQTFHRLHEALHQMRAPGRVDLKKAAARHRQRSGRSLFAQPCQVLRRSVAPEFDAVVLRMAEGHVHPLVQRVEEPLVAAQSGKLRVDGRIRQRAVRDIGDGRVVGHDIAEKGFSLDFVGVQNDLVAVAELRLRRERLRDRFGSAFEARRFHMVEQLPLLEGGFIRIVGVQIPAAGTAAEVRTAGFDPVRARRAEADDFRPRKIFLLGGDPPDQLFSRQRAGKKDDFSVDAGDAVAAEGACFDLTLEFSSGPHSCLISVFCGIIYSRPK